MARIVEGPYVTGRVTSRETGGSLAGVRVTVNQTVYTDPELTTGVTTLTTDGGGGFGFYAPPGQYTFTVSAGNANPVEPVEVLGQEEGTGAAGLIRQLSGTYLSYLQGAMNPDLIIAGTITRDTNGTATAAPVVWPDGSTGTYTADTVSAAFPGAVDAYHVTKVTGGVTTTYTQAAVTRDASTGAVTVRPAMTVA